MLDRPTLRGGGALGAVLLALVLAPAASTAASESSWHRPTLPPIATKPVKPERPKLPIPKKPEPPRRPEPKKPEPPTTGGSPPRHDPFPATPSNPAPAPTSPQPTSPTTPTGGREPKKPITIPVITPKHKHGERHGWPSFPSHKTPSGPVVQPVTTPTTAPTPPTPTTPVTTAPTPPTHTPPPSHGNSPTGSGSQPSSGTQGRHRGVVGSDVASASSGRGGAIRRGAVGARGLGHAGLSASPGGGSGEAQGRAGTRHSETKLPSAHPRQQSATIAGLIPNIPLPIPDWSKPIILGLLLICLLLAFRAWRNGLKAQRLESHSQELSADLESAQAALVPEIPPSMGALAVSVAYRPAEGPAAGGDFYDVFELDGGQVGVILGDVSGHGRNALARAAHMRYSLRAYLETGLDPRGALRLAGRVLDTDGDDLFTTVAIAVYDPAEASVTYASAGHPAPVVAGNAVHEPVTCCASPAIGWGIPTGRRQTTIPFPANARACFFSDGVTEARVDGELLGRERLGDIVGQVGTEAPATEVLERVREGADSIHDDMAACVIEATAGAAATGHVIEEFEADLRHLTAGQGERFLETCGVSSAAALETLADARRIAADQGSAMLRVERDGESVKTTALAATSLMPATPAGYPAGVSESGASGAWRRGSGHQVLAFPARA